MHEPSAFEVEMATEKLKRHKSPCTGQIPTELIKAGGRSIHPAIHELINSIWNKEELSGSGRNQSLYLFIRRLLKHTVVILDIYHFCQVHMKFRPTSC